MLKNLLAATAMLAPLVSQQTYAGGFGAGFGQGFGQQFGGMQVQPYYVPPAPPPTYQGGNPYFYQQQQRYSFPNGSLNCQTFQGAFGSQTTCR